MPTYSMLIRTPLVANTGYGNDGFSLVRGFSEAGLDTHIDPMAVRPPLPMETTKLLVKEPLSEFDYFLHHTDPAQLGGTDVPDIRAKKKIAWSMWEFTKMGPEIATDLSERLAPFDLFLAYDEVTAQAFAPHCEEAGVKMQVLQGGFWASDWRYDLRLRSWGDPFRFCMVGALHQRKNPFAAIHAFEEVRAKYGEKVELHLKTITRTLHPAMEQRYPGLRIRYEVWDHMQMRDFYAQCHAYLATSWGEGKNLPALEAQSMGIPVLYSDFGGHRQWGSSDTGWPLPGEIAEHVEGLPSFRVDHDALVSAMCEAVESRAATRGKGQLASQLVQSSDWGSVIQRFLSIV